LRLQLGDPQLLLQLSNLCEQYFLLCEESENFRMSEELAKWKVFNRQYRSHIRDGFLEVGLCLPSQSPGRNCSLTVLTAFAGQGCEQNTRHIANVGVSLFDQGGKSKIFDLPI
jgi:hypothetical protein